LRLLKASLAFSFVFILFYSSVGLAVCEPSGEVAISSAYGAVLEAEETEAYSLRDLALARDLSVN